MSLHTQELPEHLTTSSTPEMVENSRSMKLRLRERNSLLAREAGNQYGQWTVLDKPIPLMGAQRVWAQCNCGTEKLTPISDMKSGKSKSCKKCARRKYGDIPRLQAQQLQVRYNALTERCKANKFSSRTYAGVENMFTSCEHFVYYVWENFPCDDYRNLEIDRIDTKGHYAPGNIRLVTREMNAQTREVNVTVTYNGQVISAAKFARDYVKKFGSDWVREQIHKGLSAEQILELAETRQRIYLVLRGEKFPISRFAKTFGAGYATAHIAKQLRSAIRSGETLLPVLLRYTTLSTREAETVSVVME